MSSKNCLPVATILVWDTQFFGYPVAAINASKLHADELKKVLSSTKARLVYWFVDPKDSDSIQAAQENGGFLTDEKITYLKKLSSQEKIKKSNFSVQSYRQRKVTAQLLSLAIQNGRHSRFKIDPHFVNQEWRRLYTQWLIKSMSGDLADEVFVYKINDFEAGFITLRKEKNQAKIGLLCVDQKYRRQGIGKQLIQKALQESKLWRCHSLIVVTQRRNRSACNFYTSIGFTLEKIQHVYHFWLS